MGGGGCCSVEDTPSNNNEAKETSANYTVMHYQQNANDDKYTAVKNDTETLTGIVGNETTVAAKSYAGFTAKEFTQEKIAADGSTTVKIYYDRKMVTLTLNCDNGTAAKTITGKFGADVKVDVPTKTGYIFAAWNPKLPAKFPAEDAQYTAKWVKEGDYTITYKNAENAVNDNLAGYNVETETITLKPAVKSGYIFDGWYKEDSFTTKVTEITKGSTGNITLYAKWTDFVLVEGATITGKIADSKVFIDGRTVTISSFYMCNHEVTQKEYSDVMGTNPSYFNSDPADDEIQENRPVEQVSWYDAIVYCNKRSMKEGLTPCYSISNSTDPAKWGSVPTSSDSTWNAATCDFTANGYRLPTEAEWEYAVRGGNGLIGTQYTYAGSDTIDEVAWYGSNSGRKTHEVKTKKANGLGLYDMSGNVWEWCWDWNGSISGSTPATGALSGSYRCLRGGYYISNVNDDCQVAYRNEYFIPEGDRDLDPLVGCFGFRLVRTAE